MLSHMHIVDHSQISIAGLPPLLLLLLSAKQALLPLLLPLPYQANPPTPPASPSLPSKPSYPSCFPFPTKPSYPYFLSLQASTTKPFYPPPPPPPPPSPPTPPALLPYQASNPPPSPSTSPAAPSPTTKGTLEAQRAQCPSV